MKNTTTLLIALLSATGIAFAESPAKSSDVAGGAGKSSASAAASSKGASGNSGADASGSSDKAKGNSSSGSSGGYTNISPNEVPGVAWAPILGDIPGFCGMNGAQSSKSSAAILSQAKCPKPPAATKMASSKTPAASPAETTGKSDSSQARAESPDKNASGTSGAAGAGSAGGAKNAGDANKADANDASNASKDSSGASGTAGSSQVSPAAPSTPTDLSGSTGTAKHSNGGDGLPKGSPKPANSGGISGGS